jgi:superfamily II helicase
MGKLFYIFFFFLANNSKALPYLIFLIELSMQKYVSQKSYYTSLGISENLGGKRMKEQKKNKKRTS